jgi:hypothetical protein
MTREQYVERSKERALALLTVGRIREAVALMIMDMRKGPNCGVPHEIHAIGVSAAAAGDAAVARLHLGFCLTAFGRPTMSAIGPGCVKTLCLP